MYRALFALMFLALPAHADGLGPKISGDARMGLVYDRAPDWAQQRENGLRMTARARLKFEFTGETDGGVRFGAAFRLDPDTQRPKSPSVFIGE
ncbi:outer membrane protein OmpU [Roseinatronobacter thiooxidans]|uniref:Outer membrane protein OmpU n=1 Tax=Roseinatronobacter thiooxidans TaxID=121821 RepID=A0A2W7QLG9_9RHOB|nr:porin [Roseinatronobacter thiooxidans]PZX42119.1 outer membrane protein OmpU [Roseinatronobacter thiooxidans]